jgi:hypothetical protein
MSKKPAFIRGQLVYAATGLSRNNVIICLTQNDEKSKILYVPIGTIGLVISSGNRRNVRVAWTNGMVGWVHINGIQPLLVKDE